MDSIGASCTKLKKDYEECFNRWFSETFLKNLHKSEEKPCGDLFEEYRACVTIAIKEKQLDKLIQEAREKSPLGEGVKSNTNKSS